MGAIRRLAIPCVCLVAVLLAGCATPATKADTTPRIEPGGASEIVLAVVDRRSIVALGRQTAKFEGQITTRSGSYRNPNTYDRPNRPADDRFVDLLAEVTQEGFAQSGTKVSIVKLPTGTSSEDAMKKMAEHKGERYLLIVVVSSKFEFLINAAVLQRLTTAGPQDQLLYDYAFDVRVAGKDGTTLVSKEFSGRATRDPSEKYSLWDMASLLYKEQLDKVFADPSVKKALASN